MENPNQIHHELKEIKKLLTNQEKRLARIEEWSGLGSVPEPATSAADQSAPQKPKKTKKPAVSWEARIGENYLQKIGVVAVLLGLSFFLKYAFDQGWVGPTGRIVIGILLGLSFLGAGEYFVKKYQKWANVMSGGGIAMLYFSLFAARNMYELISAETTFAFMILVTVIAVLASVRYNSLPLALFSIIGGYVTPLLVGSPDPNIWVLIVYAYMLSLGVLAVSHFKQWPALQLPAFAFTAGYLVYFGAESESFSSTLILLAIFFAIYSVMPFYHHLVQKEPTKKINFILTLLNALFVTVATFSLFEEYHENYLGIAMFFLAVAYFVESALAFKRAPQNKFLMLLLMGIFVALLTIIIPIELENYKYAMTAALATEATVLFWAGLKLKLVGVRYYGAVIQSIVLLGWIGLLSEFNTKTETFVFNPLVGITLFIIALLVGTAYLYKKHQSELSASETYSRGLVIVLTNLLGIFLLTHQAGHYFDLVQANNEFFNYRQANQATQVTISVIWALYAIALIVGGIAKQIKPFRWMGLLLFGITILKVFFVDMSGLPTEYKIIAFMVLGVFLIGASFLYQRYKHLIHEKVL